jgi:hypothetical protein
MNRNKKQSNKYQKYIPLSMRGSYLCCLQQHDSFSYEAGHTPGKIIDVAIPNAQYFSISRLN